MTLQLRTIFFVLFALSGFSGLIYESIWSHYMKLFLGHSAYAQTLVLAIFMGGMALGSWLSSRYSGRWKNLFLGYALVEGTIGIFALIFHDAFDAIVTFSYNSVIPRLGTPETASAYQWILSAILILPQSVLIGMPFPLMSAGILRMFPKKPGKSVSMLYFTNSIGAALGVLISSFLLIRLVGLPGTIRTAGVINIALACVVWFLAREHTFDASFKTDAFPPFERCGTGSCYRTFLFASLVTGTASFIYEIGWIRMLSLVLGSSTHAFELMLSAFIFGLAFGGLWIQRKIDYIACPASYLVIVQVVMGSLALASLPLYGKTFDMMQCVLQTVSKTDTGYMLFNLSSYSIALAVMLPTTFCAGMTLPLITFILIKQGNGEKSIGAVYAANTIGAIIGIIFAVHVGMPLLGLKGLITVGAGLDIALGLYLLWTVTPKPYGYRSPAVITAACVCVLAGAMLFVQLDPHKMASGVYRHGYLLNPENNRIISNRDGETATVTLSLTQDGVMNIRTNGKVDAGIAIAPGAGPTPDEVTMLLAAAIPMSLHPSARTVANIGMGSGLTTHVLLTNSEIEHVDTIEIEKEIIDAAKRFGPHVELAYTDPRSSIAVDDAKTFFSIHNEKYDIIISEPSNPWVSGVASLFSEEFYQLINRHLNRDGLFVQWVQLYEIDLSLVASVLKAVSSNFTHYVVYSTTDTNLLIVARNGGPVPGPDPRVLGMPELAALLKKIGVENEQDIEVRKVGNKEVLSSLIETFPIRPNSDYFPVLDQNAARARFLKTDATALQSFSHDALPVVEMLTATRPQWDETKVTPSPFFPKTEHAVTAMALRDYFLTGSFSERYRDIPEETMQQAARLRQLFPVSATGPGQAERLDRLFTVAVQMISYLRPNELTAFWNTLSGRSSADSLSDAERDWISFFRAVGDRDAGSMAGISRKILDSGQGMPTYAEKYLVAAGMLGNLVQGNRAESLRLWSEHKEVFGSGPPPLTFRLLIANSTAAGSPSVSAMREGSGKEQL